MHTDYSKKDILVFGKGQTDRLDNTTITSDAKYSLNITKSKKEFCLSPHYNSITSFLDANLCRRETKSSRLKYFNKRLYLFYPIKKICFSYV